MLIKSVIYFGNKISRNFKSRQNACHEKLCHVGQSLLFTFVVIVICCIYDLLKEWEGEREEGEENL